MVFDVLLFAFKEVVFVLGSLQVFVEQTQVDLLTGLEGAVAFACLLHVFQILLEVDVEAGLHAGDRVYRLGLQLLQVSVLGQVVLVLQECLVVHALVRVSRDENWVAASK